MKKTTSSLIIVLILIVMAPLVGYFGTKFVLTSLWGSNAREQVETPVETEQPGQVDETTPPEGRTFSIVLPEKTVSAVQMASLSSRDGAESFAREAEGKGMTCMVMEKDGLYKVIHCGYFDGSNLSDLLAHVKEIYADAFITQKTLARKTLEIEFDSQETADAFQESVNRYFEVMMSADDYAADLVTGRQVKGQNMVDQLETLIPSMDQPGEIHSGLIQIMTMTKELFNTENSDYDAYNVDYLAILKRILDTY